MSDPAVYLVRSAAYLALFYAFFWLVLRRETFFALNRAFLLLGAGLSLVLPFLRIPSPFVKTIFVGAGLPAAVEPSVGPAQVQGSIFWKIVFIVYVAGAALVFLLFVARLARLALLASRCGCVPHRGLRIVLCGHAGESFSFFRFVFLDGSKMAAEDKDRVLTHELAHVRQLHSADIVFTELLAVIQWFNPFVWPYKRSLRETHEYLADRAVIAQGCGLTRYQLLIIEQHVGGRLLELASSFRTSQIKRRIVMLSKPQTRGLARWKPLCVLPLAMGLVLAFAESRTVIRDDNGPGTLSAPAVTAGQSVRETKPADGAPPAMTDEDMAKALKEKMLQLEQMKKKNTEALAQLKAKLAEAPDAAAQEKIQAALKEEKAVGLELLAKERALQVRKIEFALTRESDAAKKADLEKKLEVIKAEAEDYKIKADAERKAVAGPEKRAPEKRVEEP